MLEIKELRTGKGISQQELANRLEKKFQYISNIETGLRNISLEMYCKICIALGYNELETLQLISDHLGYSCVLRCV